MPSALFRHVASWLGLCLMCSACLRFGYAPESHDHAGRSEPRAEMDAGEPRMPTDAGSPQAPTMDAASGDAATYIDRVDAAPALDASASSAPPTPVDASEPAPVLDAGRPDAAGSFPAADAAAGGGTDAAVAGGDASVSVLDAGMDAGASSGRVCAAGKQLGGYCWFLSNLNQSCNAACAAHGGYEASLKWIGTRAQGGTLARCDALLTLLQGVDADTTAGTRSDGRGVGCHVFEGKRWWLFQPDFDPASYHWKANIVCSCFDK